MGSRASQAAGQIGWEEGKEEQVCCEALALAGGGFSLAGSRGQALDTRGTSIHQIAPKCWKGAGTLGSMLGPQKQAPSTLVLSAAQGCFYDIPQAHFGRGLDFKALASGEDQSLLVAVPQAHVSP